MSGLTPKDIRYIKLGPGGRWADACLEKGELRLGYRSVPHAACQAGNWAAVLKYFLEEKERGRASAANATREVRDFYSLGSNCLWVTFSRDHLWWAFADTEVTLLEGDAQENGARQRRTLAPWCNTDTNGKPLVISDLSTRLTRVAAYRQTLCEVDAAEYLLRRLRGEEEPMLGKARNARLAAISSAEEMIASLHWADFETLVDLIFANSGWRRMSRVGGSQKDIDIELQDLATGEIAFVQVKSRASQRTLRDYIERYRAHGRYSRMFFVCHSPKGELSAGEDESIFVWTRRALADMAVRAGLFDWLVEKCT